MAAKFEWDKARARIVGTAENALRDIGYVLQSRRLHLGLTQTQVAKEASRLLKAPNRIQQPQIDKLEDGILPGPWRGAGYAEIEAVLQALKWRAADIEFMRSMVKEFARIK